MIKVGINGYGTIGKRVAEAVTLQDDMEIVGIVKTKPTYEIRGALDANYPVFTSTKNKVSFFEDYGVGVSGVTENLVDIPLAELPENMMRPPKETLEELLSNFRI